jgi:hypothetical protein
VSKDVESSRIIHSPLSLVNRCASPARIARISLSSASHNHAFLMKSELSKEWSRTLSNPSISSVSSVGFSKIPPIPIRQLGRSSLAYRPPIRTPVATTERLTLQIADEIQRVTGSDDVFVVGRGSISV